jgi:hypothetical protein
MNCIVFRPLLHLQEIYSKISRIGCDHEPSPNAGAAGPSPIGPQAAGRLGKVSSLIAASFVGCMLELPYTQF